MDENESCHKCSVKQEKARYVNFVNFFKGENPSVCKSPLSMVWCLVKLKRKWFISELKMRWEA